jgi:hypothetical protein
MHRVAAKFVQLRVAICQEHFHRAKDEENVLKNSVAGNDAWVYAYDVETERQSSQWISTLPRDPKQHAKFAQM